MVDTSASRLKDAVDALGLDSELAELVNRGVADMSEEKAAQLLLGLELSLVRIPAILGARENAARPYPLEDIQESQANETVPRHFAGSRLTDPAWVHRSATSATSRIIGSLRRYFSPDLAIDLGTANTLIYVRGKGVVLDEPSVVALHRDGGPNAKKTVPTLNEQMLKQFIKMVHPPSKMRPSPRIIIGVSCYSTQVERRAIRESALGAGASDVYLIEDPMAAAIGAGLRVSEASGSMVVDIGGGTTEVGVISLGGMVYKCSIRVGSDRFDESIINYIRRNYGMLISEATAELIRKNIGSAFAGSEFKEMEVKGRNLSEGVPRSFAINSNEILEALTDPLNQIVSAVKYAVVHTPPELGADIAEHGMILTGAGALLRDLDRMLAEETGLPVVVAEDPLTCVVRGASIALERMESLGSIFVSG